MRIPLLATLAALAALAALAVASPALSQTTFPNRCEQFGLETLNIRAYIRQTCFNRAKQSVYVFNHYHPSGKARGLVIISHLPSGMLAIAHSSSESPRALWVWDGANQRFDSGPNYLYGYGVPPETLQDITQAGAAYQTLFGYPYATP